MILPQCFSGTFEPEKKAYCAKKRIGAYISVAEKTAFFEKNRYCNFERKKTDDTECRFKTCRRSTRPDESYTTAFGCVVSPIAGS
ncbi:hypothetical protein AGR7A_Lc120164 [Agrobacterium deltaense NCPPB 1641]|uniref:Uncharacterized protein n=1 Tax=Agrobacterium deltaense NCPPB 1641 TaxID=1183425 RepID=A0A1S7TVG3_9HYPH|nr:hypothetical protein AGR7A_Lc120164 [Agrobacterium deltaense NCPPB 1641]